ncbi:MAG: hypothetical protein HKN26_08400 [Acidimicrobiales bacterium]|nr:hypothetical protein [Acidimicrobiales bacterium]
MPARSNLPDLGRLTSQAERAVRYARTEARVLARRRSSALPPQTLVVATPHKVGSTWMVKLIRSLHLHRSPIVPKRFRYRGFNSLVDLAAPGVDTFLAEGRTSRLYKSHAQPPTWAVPDSVRFLTMVRDPRDALLSSAHYLANMADEFGEWHELVPLSTVERAHVLLDKAFFDLELYEAWTAYAHAVLVRYEDLLESAERELQRVVDHCELGAEVDAAAVHAAVEANSFARLSGGRQQGDEEASSFYRSGTAGGWRDTFTPELAQHFIEAADGRWQKLLLDLGYESVDDWPAR